MPALKAENVQVELIQRPVRPLPESSVGYNFARVAIISLLGILTVLLTVSIVFVLQKRRGRTPASEFGTVDEDQMNESPLLRADGLDDRANTA